VKLTVRIEGNGLGLIAQRLRQSGVRLRRAGYDVRDELIAGNRRDRLAALDRHGRRMPPRKRPRADGARGPVMSPHHTRSRVIANYQARVTISSQGWRVESGWIGDVEWLAYHAAGTVRGAPVRDVIGVTPETRRRAIAIIREAVRPS
jgi:hypothetical protein